MKHEKNTCGTMAAGGWETADQALVQLFRLYPDQALQELDRRYRRYCYQIAYQILNCREDAEECVNDVLFRCWETIPKCQPNCLRAYLGATARNLAINRYRKEHAKKRGGSAVEVPLYENALGAKQTAVEAIFEAVLIRQCLEVLLGQYSAADRQLFLDRYCGRQAVSDLAKNFGLSEACVRSRLCRMRRRLRQELARCGITA